MPKFPDEIIDETIARNARDGEARWEDGDFYASVVDEFLPYFLDERVSEDRRPAVARRVLLKSLADQTGVNLSTMADSESMARKFPPVVRKKWDMLSYHQLRACAAAGDDWERWALWAVNYADRNGGNIAPVRVIRRVIGRTAGKGDAWEKWLDKMLDLSYKIIDDNGAPTPIVESVRDWSEYVKKIKV